MAANALDRVNDSAPGRPIQPSHSPSPPASSSLMDKQTTGRAAILPANTSQHRGNESASLANLSSRRYELFGSRISRLEGRDTPPSMDGRDAASMYTPEASWGDAVSAMSALRSGHDSSLEETLKRCSSHPCSSPPPPPLHRFERSPAGHVHRLANPPPQLAPDPVYIPPGRELSVLHRTKNSHGFVQKLTSTRGTHKRYSSESLLGGIRNRTHMTPVHTPNSHEYSRSSYHPSMSLEEWEEAGTSLPTALSHQSLRRPMQAKDNTEKPKLRLRSEVPSSNIFPEYLERDGSPLLRSSVATSESVRGLVRAPTGTRYFSGLELPTASQNSSDSNFADVSSQTDPTIDPLGCCEGYDSADQKTTKTKHESDLDIPSRSMNSLDQLGRSSSPHSPATPSLAGPFEAASIVPIRPKREEQGSSSARP